MKKVKITKTIYNIKDKNYRVVIIVNPTLKRINFRFKPNEFYISSPVKITDSALLDYINQYKKYIDKYCDVKKTLALHLWGKLYNLVLIKSLNDNYFIHNNEIIIYYKNENNINNIIKDMYKKELLAKPLLAILKEVEKAYGLKEATISLNKNCSYYKSFYAEYLKKDYSIKLSTMLAKYDEKALYHIFCHEVAHHFYLNHSSDFYNLLLNIDPLYLENKNNMKKLANEIRDKDYL